MSFVQRCRPFKLSPGEELLVKGTCTLIVQLSIGVVYLAGRALEVNRTYSFSLHLDSFPSLSFYTLEGGTLLMKVLRDRGTFEALRGVTGMADLHRFVFRDLIRNPTGPLRIAVLGRPGIGKSCAAVSLCHLLQQAHTEIGASRRMFLMDLNPTSNGLFAPGCLSSREVFADASPLWIGQMSNPIQPSPTLSFFCGTTLRPSTAPEGVSFLHFADQSISSTVGWVEEQLLESTTHFSSSSPLTSDPSLDGWYGMVVDVASPSGSLLAVPFYKQLLQLLQPTHVVVVSDEVPPGSGEFEDDALHGNEMEGDEEEDDDEEDEDDDERRRERREARREARRLAKGKKERETELGGVNAFYLRDPSSRSFPLRWIPSLMEDIQNFLPECEILRVRPSMRDTRAMLSMFNASRSPSNKSSGTNPNGTPCSGDDAGNSSVSQTVDSLSGKDYLRPGIVGSLLRQYFVGGRPYPSLGCSKVVLPLSAIQLVELQYDRDIVGVKALPVLHPPEVLYLSKYTGTTGGGNMNYLGQSNTSGTSFGGMVCSLSHAEVLEEVPFAPTAGLLVLLYIDEETEEVALTIPSASSSPLERKFIVLPSRVSTPFSVSGTMTSDRDVANVLLERDEGLFLTSRQMGWLEEATVA